MNYTDIIWDFNGTILDDVDAGIKSVNKLLFDRGLDTIKDKEHYRSLFKFPIIEYYRDLGFDFETEPYEVLAPIWVAEYLKNCKKAKIREGFMSAFLTFKKMGLRQSVLSATELSMLKNQLSELGIADLFDGIYGLDNIHAHSKTALAKVWCLEHPDARALFVGDTDHDYITACAIGADCALVCGGHHSKEKLLSCQSATVYDSLDAFCRSFAENQQK